MECYAMGRSCLCISKLKWVEQFSWGDLTQKHEQWRRQIIHFEGQVTESSPKLLKVELERYGKRSLAEICQMALKNRPWKDVKKTTATNADGNESEEVEVSGEGIVRKKKRKPRQSERFKREHKVCHFHTTWEPKWKQIECSQCDASFCFGTLARAFDMKPQEILAEKDWKCPRCRNFCICRRCREKPGWKMIEPPRIMLGHDTNKVADPRSVESLVDYSQSNISWLQKVGDDGTKDTRRLQKRKQAAEKAKAQKPELGDHYVEDANMTGPGDQEVENNLLRLAQHEGIPIDPNLESGTREGIMDGDSPVGEERYNENPEEAGLGDIYEPYHRGPPQPQHVIPAGCIIRDAEHAYDATEAITFYYPDPELDLQFQQPKEQQPLREQRPPGYKPAEPPEEPAKIEMIQRKRKRSGVEPGEEPYKSQKRVKDAGNKKKKPRKSLVVKLNIDKSKLAELNKMAIIAQRALKGVEEDDTPVIGSDLRALNAESGAANAQQPPRKVRLEHEDEDDEFTGPRVRRDRQTSIPEPHKVPTRRTRTQNVAYDEPSDVEEFAEIPSSQSSRRRSESRQGNDGAQSQSSTSTPAESGGTDASSPVDHNIDPSFDEQTITIIPAQDRARTDEIRSFAAINKINTPLREGTKSRVAKRIPSNGQLNSNDPLKSTQSRSAPTKVTTASAKTVQKEQAPQQRHPEVSEAEKNRKAKLAAMHWAEGDSDDFSANTWSASGEEDELFVPGTRPPRANTADAKSRLSLPGPTVAASKWLPVDVQRSASVRKAKAADWDKKDTSDEEVLEV
jgi:Zinc-finger domain of monoamine-oxidase A repressor R1